MSSWKEKVIACSVAAILAFVIGVTNADPRWLYAVVAVSLGVYVWRLDRAERRASGSGGIHGTST